MTENRRIYFVRKAGLITGPFTVTKLRLMVDRGTLGGEDQFSTDKSGWRPVSTLFPERFPEAEVFAPELPEEENAGLPQPFLPPELPPPEPEPEFLPEPSPVTVPVRPVTDAGTVPPWLRDTAALIVLPWELETEAPLMRMKKWKLVLAAALLNLLPCALLLGLSCQRYAFRLPWPWAPLYAAGLLLAVGLAAAAAARIIAVFKLPPGSTPPEEWKLLGIAFFMNYGMLCGTLTAFYPCFRDPAHAFAGALLSGAFAMLTVGAGTLLTGRFLERFRAVPAKWAFLIVPLLTAGMAGMICFLIELVRIRGMK